MPYTVTELDSGVKSVVIGFNVNGSPISKKSGVSCLCSHDVLKQVTIQYNKYRYLLVNDVDGINICDGNDNNTSISYITKKGCKPLNKIFNIDIRGMFVRIRVGVSKNELTYISFIDYDNGVDLSVNGSSLFATMYLNEMKCAQTRVEGVLQSSRLCDD